MSEKKIPDPNLSPFTPKVLGLLRPHISQYTDPSGTILTPRKNPRLKVDCPYPPPSGTAAAVCVPAELVGSFTRDPNSNPYAIGDAITFEIANPPTGSEPITVEWYKNGALADTGGTYNYTVSGADVQYIDPNTEIGVIFIMLLVYNACGFEFTDPIFAINVYTGP